MGVISYCEWNILILVLVHRMWHISKNNFSSAMLVAYMHTKRWAHRSNLFEAKTRQNNSTKFEATYQSIKSLWSKQWAIECIQFILFNNGDKFLDDTGRSRYSTTRIIFRRCHVCIRCMRIPWTLERSMPTHWCLIP